MKNNLDTPNIAREDAIRLIETNVEQCVHCGWLPDFVGKVFDPASDALVNQLNDKLKDLFKDVDKQFIAAMEKQGLIALTPAQRQKLLSEILEPVLLEMRQEIAFASAQGVEAGRLAALEEVSQAGLSINVTEFSETSRRIITNRAFEASEETMQRLVGNVAGSLGTSFENGLGISQAATQLQTVFDGLKTFELERIARTEINSAQNEGNFEGKKEAGVQFKMWLTAQDDRVRGSNPKDAANHIILHGEVRRIDEPYSNGLMYPLDRNSGAALAEIINCRCKDKSYFPAKGELITNTPYYPLGKVT